MTTSERLQQLREQAAPKGRISAAAIVRSTRANRQTCQIGQIGKLTGMLNKREPKPKRQKDPRHCPEFIAWMHQHHGCLIFERGLPGCAGPVEFNHHRRHGERKDDRRGFLLCKGHHTDGAKAYHRIKRSFAAAFGLDLEAEIQWYWMEFQEWRAEHSARR